MAVMVVAGVRVFGIDRHDAAMRHFTLRMFELDRRVVYAKTLMKRRLDLLENSRALRRRNIVNRDVGGQRVRV